MKVAFIGLTAAIAVKQRFVDGLTSSEQKNSFVQQKWVELPDCKGETGEIWLADDLNNVTIATCKKNPKLDIAPSANWTKAAGPVKLLTADEAKAEAEANAAPILEDAPAATTEAADVTAKAQLKANQ